MIIEQPGCATRATHLDDEVRLTDYLDRHLANSLAAPSGVLAQAASHVLAAPGKLMRPRLLLDACLAAGGDPERALPAAAGTEYGHIASLIHDDIIDGDGERRGQETLHRKYSLPTAILTGDLFIFQTFLSYTHCHERGISAERVLTAINLLSRTCVEVCEGQALEAAMAGQLDTTEEAYLQMIRLKSASVCRAASEIGACLAEGPDEFIGALRAYGEHLGMAFQIIDDVLAYDGVPSLLGKPQHSDLSNGRVTIPIIYAIDAAGLAGRQQISALFWLARTDPDTSYAQLVKLLVTTHALERARQSAALCIEQAKRQLNYLPSSDARERLRALADLVVTRDH
ncbi:MAG: hepT2 [Chloroflexi bacterium]|nr:hepT2 [Chloroflexota bacterium]